MSLTPFIQFTAGTPAIATEVNSNFSYITDWVDDDSMPRNGTVAFTGVPSGPATDPPSADSLTRRQYVDNKMKSNTGIQLGGHTPTPAYVSNAWTVVATATTGTAIPVNATNNVLLLQMFGNIELQGDVGKVAGSFGMKLEYCFDTNAAGTTGTWTSIGTISDATALVGGLAYGGISMSGFAYDAPASAKIVGVRMQVINRGGDLTSLHTGTPRLNFMLTRQVALA